MSPSVRGGVFNCSRRPSARPAVQSARVATTTALHGLQVLELGAGSLPAQVAGMLLADNGARVVKVEPPEGDRLRQGLPSGFLVWNRGKESLVADLRTPDGRTRSWPGRVPPTS